MQLVTGTGRLRCDEVTLPGLHGYINEDMTEAQLSSVEPRRTTS